jgi:hypothetical protein
MRRTAPVLQRGTSVLDRCQGAARLGTHHSNSMSRRHERRNCLARPTDHSATYGSDTACHPATVAQRSNHAYVGMHLKCTRVSRKSVIALMLRLWFSVL